MSGGLWGYTVTPSVCACVRSCVRASLLLRRKPTMTVCDVLLLASTLTLALTLFVILVVDLVSYVAVSTAGAVILILLLQKLSIGSFWSTVCE